MRLHRALYTYVVESVFVMILLLGTIALTQPVPTPIAPPAVTVVYPPQGGFFGLPNNGHTLASSVNTSTSMTKKIVAWSDTLDMLGKALSDRLIVMESKQQAALKWIRNEKTHQVAWLGTVGWYDGPPKFTSVPLLGTSRYGAVTNTSDNLFLGNGSTSTADADMIYN
jgi:hypothetical protein